jgi:YbgC/YbaW family acyl-CoA thioester hydrolase
MAYEFKLIRRIEFSETDMAGIVHFSNFFRMMESAEHAFFRSLGFSVHPEGATTGWPRVSATCDYLRPLRFEDEVEIHLLVAELRTRSLRYQFAIRKAGEPADAARGSLTVVCATLDPVAGRLVAVPIPEAIRSRLEVAPAELLARPGPLSVQSQPG